MAELVQILDSYAETVAPKLMEQYKPDTAPKLNALLEATGAQKDELEAATLTVRSGMYLPTAIGAQLDLIGAVFNVARDGKSDVEYRQSIRIISAMRSFASWEDVISVLRGVYGAAYVHMFPDYPAHMRLVTDAPVTKALVENFMPAGTSVGLAAYLVDMDGAYIVTDGSERILLEIEG